LLLQNSESFFKTYLDRQDFLALMFCVNAIVVFSILFQACIPSFGDEAVGQDLTLEVPQTEGDLQTAPTDNLVRSYAVVAVGVTPLACN
jgi:hypothetical protein